MNAGNLEGGFWRRYKGILRALPPVFASWSPKIPPLDSQVSLSTPGLFHTLDMWDTSGAFESHWAALNLREMRKQPCNIRRS